MSDKQVENRPDIDEGLKGISQEVTVADLMRDKGQRKKVKLMKESQLKKFINEALSQVMGENVHNLADEQREEYLRQTEAKLAEVMKRANEAENERMRLAEEKAAKEEQLQSALAEGDPHQLKEAVEDLQRRLAETEQQRDTLRQDLDIVEQDAENIRSALEASIVEKDDANGRMQETMLKLTRHTTDLVQGVLGLDEQHYASKHQQENEADEELEGVDVFFHDFGTSANVIQTLSTDLQRLRDIVRQKEEEDEAQPDLLESDLQILADLKAGSLAAVDVAAPVDNLIEALHGVSDEVHLLQTDLAPEGDDPAPVTDLPDAEGDPAEVLAGASRVVRELAATVAAERAKVAAISAGKSEENQKALREQMIRSNDLIESVLNVDNQFYAGRHQEENPAPESDDPLEAFYNDFATGAKVMESLAQDLERLQGITSALKDATGEDLSAETESGMLDRDLELLHQVKEGSLQGMDVAAPVEGLLEALNGTREEIEQLRLSADDALQVNSEKPHVSALPDEAGEPSAVLAASTQVVREMAAALASERKRIAALKALAEDADAARASTEEEVEASHQAIDRLAKAVASKAGSMDVEVPAVLEDNQAEDVARLVAAEETLAALEPGIGGDAAEELAKLAEDLMGEDARHADFSQTAGQEDVLNELKEQVKALGQRFQDSDGERKRLEAELAAATSQQDEIKTQSDDLQVELDTALAERDAIKDEIERLQGEVASAQSERDTVKSDVERLQGELDGAQGERETVQADVERLQGELSTVQSDYESAKADVERLQAELESAQEEQETVKSGAANLQGDLDAAKSDAERLQEELDVAKSERDGLKSEAEQLQAALDEAKAQHETVQSKAESLEGELESVQAERDEVKSDAERLLSELQEAAQERDSVKANVENLENELVEARGHLQEDVDAARRERDEAREALTAANATLADARTDLQDKLSELQRKEEEVKGLQAGWEASREHERELAEHVKALAQTLQPVLSTPVDDEAEAVEVKVAAVSQAVDGAKAVPEAHAEDEQHEAVIDSMQQLIDSLAERASVEASKPKADGDQVRSIAREILEVAGVAAEDSVEKPLGSDADAAAQVAKAEEDADIVLTGDDEDPSGSQKIPTENIQITPEALLVRSRAVVEELADKANHLEEDLEEEKTKGARLLGEKRALQDRLDTEVRELHSKLEEREAELKDKAEELQAAQEELNDTREMVASGREIIEHLGEKQRKDASDLQQTKAALAQSEKKLQSHETRLEKAERGERRLSEILSELGERILTAPMDDEDKADLESARVDLEVALSEVPDDPGVPVRDDLADDLADAGENLLKALEQHEDKLVNEVDRLKEQVSELEEEGKRSRDDQAMQAQTAQNLETDLEQSRARLSSAQAEVERLNTELSARSREVGQAREEGASLQAELETVRKNLDGAKDNIRELEDQVSVLDGVRRELDDTKEAAESARQAHRELATAVDDLAKISGDVVKVNELATKEETVRFARAREKLEGATASEETGIHTIADRNKEVIGALKDQIALVGDRLTSSRAEADEAKQHADELSEKLSAAEVQNATITASNDNLHTELDDARNARDAAESRIQELQKRIDADEDKLGELESELAGYRAREEVGQGGLSEQNQRLKDELDQLGKAHDELETRLAGIDEEHEIALTAVRTSFEEARKQVTERDNQIRDLQSQLDAAGGQRVDVNALRSEIDTLQEENAAHLSRIAELEAMVGEGAGASGRVGSLAEELRSTQQQRDTAHTKLTEIENQLIEERANNEGLRAARERNRQDSERKLSKLKSDHDRLAKKLETTQERVNELMQDNASLEAKLDFERKRKND